MCVFVHVASHSLLLCRRLISRQRLGQLFGIDVRALLAAPSADEPAGPQRFSLDAAAVDLALGFFCVGSVFVTSLEVAFPGQPAFALTPAQLTDIFTRLSAATTARCRAPPLFVWLPDYADAIVPPLASVGAPAQAPSAFMQWPFLPSLDEAASPSSATGSTGPGTAASTGASAAAASGGAAAHTASTLSGLAAAAVFEPARMQRLARAVARDARALGFHVLGSGIEIGGKPEQRSKALDTQAVGPISRNHKNHSGFADNMQHTNSNRVSAIFSL